MFQDPELMLIVAHDIQRELIQAADRQRRAARAARSRRRHGHRRAGSTREPSRADAAITPGAFAARAQAVGALFLRDARPSH